MKFILLIPPIFFFSCKQATQVKPGAKVIDLDFGFKAIASDSEDFKTFKTYSHFELLRNNKLLFTDTTVEYEFGDKLYPLLLKTGSDSFELLFEVNDRPSKNYLNRIFINQDKVVGQDKLPTFIGNPVDINKDGIMAYAGYRDYQVSGVSPDSIAYSPILYYSITKTGLKLDSALTKQQNEMIYGKFFGFEFSERFGSFAKKFKEEIKLIESLNCKEVQIGTFENSTRVAWIVKTRDKQIEITKQDSSFYTEWKLKYINDCEYLMILSANKSKGDQIFAIGDTIKVTVGEILNDRYLWTAVYKSKTFNGYSYFAGK
jgi:hypothetical protein